jgi:nanoRNase/pAp phosphatase (c-di-AMP/oligoRNAs hydrolase)
MIINDHWYRMIKRSIPTIKQKNVIIDNIIDTIINKHSFLLCGHKSPDEDCIASMVAMAIILNKFDKLAMIYLGSQVPENLTYLISICKYNSIKVLGPKTPIRVNFDALIFCDTPKRSMLDINNRIEQMIDGGSIVKIEIDHHIGGDGEYIGDEGYCFVTEASSSSELVGFMALKLRAKKNLLHRYLISDPFSRNLVLSILTGIVGDTQKGQYLKSRREKRYYDIFSNMYNSILMRMTVRETNFTNLEEVFTELQHLTQKEEQCFEYIMSREKSSRSIGYIVLGPEEMYYLHNQFDDETIILVTKAIANQLAEKSGKLSLICYYDRPETTGLVQFRMRRSHSFKNFDLREILRLFSFDNGGGHEGAVGFRIEQSKIGDINDYVNKFIRQLEKELDAFG